MAKGRSIAAAYDARFKSPLLKKPSQPNDQRRLAGTADRQIADHDYRDRKAADVFKSMPVRPAAKLDDLTK